MESRHFIKSRYIHACMYVDINTHKFVINSVINYPTPTKIWKKSVSTIKTINIICAQKKTKKNYSTPFSTFPCCPTQQIIFHFIYAHKLKVKRKGNFNTFIHHIFGTIHIHYTQTFLSILVSPPSIFISSLRALSIQTQN